MQGTSAADLLAAGKAFADLSGWRKFAVTGGDAAQWLDDLVTADLSGLAPGGAHPALFLAPTGGIRASFTVTLALGSILLIQDPRQPGPVGALLERYVLSSDVVLEDRTNDFLLFAFPGGAPPKVRGAVLSAPSVLGAGTDLLARIEHGEAIRPALEDAFVEVGPEGVEAWRIAEGLPRFGIDALEGDLPQEAGLDDAVARGKGCFPGQEAVAKVDTLGHPRRVVLAFEADGQADAGDAVMRNGSEVGQITSVTPAGDRSLLLARLRWDARDTGLHTERGTELRRRGR